MMKNKPAVSPEKDEVTSKEEAVRKLKNERAKIKRETEIFVRKIRTNTANNK